MALENIFGKIHGRFDDASARTDQRSLEDALISTFRAIPPERRGVAIQKFNDAMMPVRSLSGYEIREINS